MATSATLKGRASRQRGVSMIDLAIFVTIMMIMAPIAIPQATAKLELRKANPGF